MRIFIYISGILGVILLMIRFIGIIADFSGNDAFLISGLGLIIPVFIPLMAVDRYRYNRKIDQIIESYKGKPSKPCHISADKSESKGWSMNNSPFIERKGGLTWGGGNMKAANATQGKKKSFLK